MELHRENRLPDIAKPLIRPVVDVFESGNRHRRIDRIRIHLPAGYKPESLPNPVSLDTEWGTFTSSCELKDGTVVVFQEFITKRFREPAERFDDFRTFVRAVNKAYQANLVLVKE